MYSGDVPSTSGHHNSQPPFYSHPPPIHHAQGASSSQDAPPEESQGSSSPQYIEMMPMRVSNGGVEQMGIDGGGGGEEFPLEEMIGEDPTIGMRLEGEVGEVNKTNGDGGGGEKKNIPPPIIPKKFKVEQYNIKKNIREFWPVQKQRVEKMSVKYLREAGRNQVLPLARVKKIMKIDENVQKQMIAADAPLLLSVASEMFIEELTLRSWEITEESKRKTLQKTDVATASTRHEHMDFLIDIVPRTGIQPRPKEQMRIGGGGGGHAQMVQIVREGGATVGQLLKGGAILAEGVPSTSSQQEFSARLESGEEAQVIQIGKPIPLSSQAISQLGLGPLPPPVAHHSSHPSHPSHPPLHQSHSTHSPHFQVPHPPQHPSSHLHSHPSQHSHSSSFSRPSTSSQSHHPSHSRPSTSSSSLHSSYPSTSSHSYQFHPSTPQSHHSQQSHQSHSSISSLPHQSHPSTSSHSQPQNAVRIPSHLVSTPQSHRGKVIPGGGKGVPNRQYQPYPSPSQAGPSRSKN